MGGPTRTANWLARTGNPANTGLKASGNTHGRFMYFTLVEERSQAAFLMTGACQQGRQLGRAGDQHMQAIEAGSCLHGKAYPHC